MLKKIIEYIKLRYWAEYDLYMSRKGFLPLYMTLVIMGIVTNIYK